MVLTFVRIDNFSHKRAHQIDVNFDLITLYTVDMVNADYPTVVRYTTYELNGSNILMLQYVGAEHLSLSTLRLVSFL